MVCLRLVLAGVLSVAAGPASAQEPDRDDDDRDSDGDRAPARATAFTPNELDAEIDDAVAPRSPPGPRPPSDAPRAVSAVRRTSPIAIDGRLDEDAWAAAEAQGDFYVRQPDEGRPNRFRTDFKLLYDREALYVGIRAHDDHPERIVRFLKRRDVDNDSDKVAVSIDSYADRRTAFRFVLNAGGWKRDVLHFNDSEQDPTWDAVWDGASRVDERGWTAEFRIPFSQLRFSDTAGQQTWGIQIARFVGRTHEYSLWSPWPRDSPLEVSSFGTVSGIDDIDRRRRLELLPYAVAGAELARRDPADPLGQERGPIGKLGLDFKAPLPAGLGLTGTINPDFGQVEADPSQVNLTTAEIVLEEKRPFFVEGTEIFRVPIATSLRPSSATLFYTRRIGAAPHRDAADEAEFARAPDATTIYAAGKVTGKTSDGWSVGLLDAVTGQEEATVVASAGAEPERLVVEPLTNYAIGRVRKDLRGGRTAIGGVATAVHRSLEGTGLDWLHDQAYTGGLELNHRMDGGWLAEARLSGSHVHGAPAALDRTQRSSRRFFQRPDAHHLDYDPTRTSLSGAALALSFGKVEAGEWRAATGAETRLPGFEIGDIGVQQNADFVIPWVWAQHRDERPGRILNDHAETLTAWHEWDTAPTFLGNGVRGEAAANLVSLWGGSAGGSIVRDRNDPAGLRGGPMLRRDTWYEVFVNLRSDPRSRVHGSVNARRTWVPVSNSRSHSVSPFVTVQARDDLEIALGPTLATSVDDSQYVAEVMGADGTPRYLTGRIRQVTTALTLRGSYNVSPALGVQLYAQPFLSAGRYLDYKEANDPQAAAYGDRYSLLSEDETVMEVDGVRSVDRDGDGVTDFSFPLADFNLRELRSNLIVRWEFRPGSTAFLIWSHGRTSLAPDGRYLLADDLSALADQPGEHVILAKLTYWFGL